MTPPDRHIEVEELRELTEADLRTLQSFVPEELTSQDAEAMAEWLPDIIGADEAALFVARNPDGEVVAALVANFTHCMSKRRGRIDDVVTHPDWRRRGYAGALLDDAVEWLRERGVTKVELTSEPDLKPAHELYRERGFERKETFVFELKF